jgi:hypothetical protein
MRAIAIENCIMFPHYAPPGGFRPVRRRVSAAQRLSVRGQSGRNPGVVPLSGDGCTSIQRVQVQVPSAVTA